MPVKPTAMALDANSIAILKAIRSNATYSYQERITVATRDNLKEIGHAMME